MKTRLLAITLTTGGAMLTLNSPAQAQIPILRGGTSGFRAAYFRPDGPQPFSTRSMRERAARSQGNARRGTIFGGFSSRYQRAGSNYRSSRRLGLFARRGNRFR